MKLRATPEEDDIYVAPLAAELLGRWCRISLVFPSSFRPQIVMLRAESGAGDLNADTYYSAPSALSRSTGRRSIIAYLPATATAMRVSVFGDTTPIAGFDVVVEPLSRWQAGLRIALRHPIRMATALNGGLRGIGRRARTAMVVIAGGLPPASYAAWTISFDRWTSGRIARLLASKHRAQWPSIEARVCGTPGSAAMVATLASLDRQVLPLSPASDGADYVALIQAGEILPPHAIALFADWIAMLGRPDAVYADEDSMDREGQRHSPIFKPEPNRTLMMSGTLASGTWVIRRSCLPDAATQTPRWAAPLRLETWLRLYEYDGARKTHRMPYIATHRREDTASAPMATMAAVVEDHLRRMSITATVEHTWPIVVQPSMPAGAEPHVTIIIPSACRSSHVIKCLSAVAERTSYPNFDMIVILSQRTPADDRQKQVIAALEANDRIKVVFHAIKGGFNYAMANNYGVEIATGPLTCLLNDDVEPMHKEWLTNMVGHMTDPRVGVVGAKLYYSNDQVQHGGVCLGLSGLCCHLSRFLPRGAPGYAYRGILDQQLLAVTGACLLTARALYRSVGGMDERYASAFNDVDYCLKVGAAGKAVIFSARSELYHYESTTFVQHYDENETARWARDVSLMRDRWHAFVANDPFHSPNLSKVPGHEWSPAFPPFANCPSDMIR